jgi:hypothetical protein
MSETMNFLLDRQEVVVRCLWQVARPKTKPNAENATMAELDAAVKIARTERDAARVRAVKALIMGATHAFV